MIKLVSAMWSMLALIQIKQNGSTPINTTSVSQSLSTQQLNDMEKCVRKLNIEKIKALGIKVNKQMLDDSVPDESDVMMTLPQCEQALKELSQGHVEQMKTKTGGNSSEEDHNTNEPSHQRKKRNVIDVMQHPSKKWKMPIRYHIDTTNFNAKDVGNIHRALDMLEGSTCLRFQEVSLSDAANPRLFIKRSNPRCFSYIGFSHLINQTVNLGETCMTVGSILHELGHAFGMYHEHARPDRDEYITVNIDNVDDRLKEEFAIQPSTLNYSVDYDPTSMMTYGNKAFLNTTKNGYTLVPKDPKYLYTIGQRNEASFKDYTILNRMYNCECPSPSITCYNGGYPNPGISSKCTSCLCPSGLHPSNCLTADVGSPGCQPLSGDLYATDDVQCVQSPNYGVKPYDIGDTCSWLIKAGEGEGIVVWFDLTLDFGVFHNFETCFHWVEINYKGNLTNAGPRYCGSWYQELNQRDVLTSTNNEVLINFKSDFEISHTRDGFKLCYKLAPPKPTGVTTEKTTTTSTTLKPTSTAIPTTTTPKPATTAPNFKVFLVGGKTANEGRIELEVNGIRGTVCGDHFDDKDAQVVCRMLGYTGTSIAVGSSLFGKGSGTVWLDDLQCTGTEEDLADCQHENDWKNPDCSHSKDAGVLCFNDNPTPDIRVQLVGGRNNNEGRVEITRYGITGTVCDDRFDKNDAAVICRMLGFDGRSKAVNNARYGAGTGQIWLDSLQCIGNEDHITDCPHNGWGKHDCLHAEDVGVKCSNLDLQVFLVGGETSTEGRIELVHNGIRGTVCNDNFGDVEARVVCRMLGFNGVATAITDGTFGPGTGRIWLDDVKCKGRENTIKRCNHSKWGYHNCVHSQDVGVRCSQTITDKHDYYCYVCPKNRQHLCLSNVEKCPSGKLCMSKTDHRNGATFTVKQCASKGTCKRIQSASVPSVSKYCCTGDRCNDHE